MTEPASLTPVGDHLRSYGIGVGYGPGARTHMPGCAAWHPWCAYAAGRAESLAQLADDLEGEAAELVGQDEPPWGAMYGLKVTSGPETALILRRAADLARQRAGRPADQAASSEGGRPVVPP